MILINFSHPVPEEQCGQIEAITHADIESTVDVPVQFDNGLPFAEQVSSMVDAIELTRADWETKAILINPPAYNFAAVTLMAELHGRMGYFPAIVRIREVKDSLPPRYEVAEIINLKEVRDRARERRAQK